MGGALPGGHQERLGVLGFACVLNTWPGTDAASVRPSACRHERLHSTGSLLESVSSFSLLETFCVFHNFGGKIIVLGHKVIPRPQGLERGCPLSRSLLFLGEGHGGL